MNEDSARMDGQFHAALFTVGDPSHELFGLGWRPDSELQTNFRGDVMRQHAA